MYTCQDVPTHSWCSMKCLSYIGHNYNPVLLWHQSSVLSQEVLKWEGGATHCNKGAEKCLYFYFSKSHRTWRECEFAINALISISVIIIIKPIQRFYCKRFLKVNNANLVCFQLVLLHCKKNGILVSKKYLEYSQIVS